MTFDTNDEDSAWQSPIWIAHTNCLLNSYERLIGRSLIPRSTPEVDARNLFEASFVVVAHGTETDPLLSYGNVSALRLWKMPLSTFLGTPSRKTAEPVHRDERAELLRRTTENGFIDDYSGIRIASTGDRFRILKATVWNVADENGQHIGQAATFAEWLPL
jgi:hypothetical protein